MYFSDVYADRRVPEKVAQHPLLYTECLGGALYWNDLVRLAKQAGFLDPRLVTDSPISVSNAELADLIGNVNFYSATYRLFRLDGLEPAFEDYGQAVIYKGTIPEHPNRLDLDKHHRFDTGRVVPVCGNTWRMLDETRFEPHFEFIGDMSAHFGIFANCGAGLPFDAQDSRTDSEASGCC